jgi:predicted nucleic acid-binding protein
VRYLLDVSPLVALGAIEHEFHRTTAKWVNTLKPEDELVTCALTELGFVRILSQIPQYGFTVDQARALLLGLKNAGAVRFSFLPDDQDASALPSWVKAPRQITDGHLAHLAKANGAVLATLDRNIPGAFVIPET